jgi:GNAT superfamily N-acetyltransferase
MVCALAAYERAPNAVTATVEDFRTALFGPSPRAYCLVAEVPASAVGRHGAASTAGLHVAGLGGMALWFETFSTWEGRHGIWLEDLFVHPQHRGGGLGRLLLQRLAAICVERGYRRLEWKVLDWNEPALGFYRRVGAQALDEWTVHRLSGDALHRLAAGDRAAAANSVVQG